MLIRVGYELAYEFAQATPMILNLNVHYSRASDLVRPDTLVTDPKVPLFMYRDGYGNWCTRAVAPPGSFKLTADAVVRDSGIAEPAFPFANEHSVESLPEEALVYLLPSRYCETEHLSAAAWKLFGGMMPGWSRVQAICDYVHRHVAVRLSMRASHENGMGDIQRADRGVPRLRASGDHTVPMSQHSGALLHRLSGRYRRSRQRTRRWILPVGWKPILAAPGRYSTRAITSGASGAC